MSKASKTISRRAMLAGAAPSNTDPKEWVLRQVAAHIISSLPSSERDARRVLDLVEMLMADFLSPPPRRRRSSAAA